MQDWWQARSLLPLCVLLQDAKPIGHPGGRMRPRHGDSWQKLARNLGRHRAAPPTGTPITNLRMVQPNSPALPIPSTPRWSVLRHVDRPMPMLLDPPSPPYPATLQPSSPCPIAPTTSTPSPPAALAASHSHSQVSNGHCERPSLQRGPTAAVNSAPRCCAPSQTAS